MPSDARSRHKARTGKIGGTRKSPQSSTRVRKRKVPKRRKRKAQT